MSQNQVDHLRTFHNRLRLLLNLDHSDLVSGDILVAGDKASWERFMNDPLTFFIQAGETRLRWLWALIRSRESHPDRPAHTGGAAIAVAVCVAALFATVGPANAHDWFDRSCCSGRDCEVVDQSEVHESRAGYQVDGNSEIIPHSSRKVRQTPPEGGGNYAICTVGGVRSATILCIYVPPMGS